MPVNHKVSIVWQIVFTFLPIVNLWAFYRIRRLTKYFLYILLPTIVFGIGITVAFIVWALSQGHLSGTLDQFGGGYTLSTEPSSYWLSVIANAVGIAFQGFSIYLVIIWSRQHNRQFDPQETAF
jgi:glucan phosphoethanolaminetransferase (alkaline phosphatase superfamily)